MKWRQALNQTESKTMVMWMLTELRGRMDGMSEDLHKKIVSVKKDIEAVKKKKKSSEEYRT